MTYGRSICVEAKFAPTVEQVRIELDAEGFSVVSEIDVAAILRKKLGVQLEDYLILGACNAPMAHEALKTDRSFGLLMPCNIVVRAADRRTTIVEALNPKVMIDLAQQPDLQWIAEDAALRLDRVLCRVASELVR